jgi:hypothetical protein
MRAYISGPITGLDRDVARARFEAGELQLVALGHVPVNPLKIKNPDNCGCELQFHTWECNLRKDIRELVSCQAIFLLRDWEISSGSRLELHIAIALSFAIWFAEGRPSAADVISELRVYEQGG